MENWVPVAVGLAAGLAFIVLLALSLGKSISIVIIPEGSSLETSERNN